MDLGKRLSMLNRSNYNPDEELAGVFSPPVEESQPVSTEPEGPIDYVPASLSIDQYLSDTGYKAKSKPSAKASRKERSERGFLDDIPISREPSYSGERDLDDIAEDTQRLIQSADLIQADEFDQFLTEGFSAEEDAEMRNHLIGLGRKYARDSAQSKESSEISRTFADSEKRLKALYDEIESDKQAIEKDIARMRVPGRGGKVLSDLIAVKKELLTTQVQIIDKTNAMRKTVFELRAKEAAKKEAAEAGNNDINSNMLQGIFSSARSSVVESMGGYSGISGSRDEDDDLSYYNDDVSDEEIQQKYFSANQGGSSDGDKFMEYEGRGVEYILLIDSEEHVQGVIAEDRDGILIPDYPMPSSIDQLSFTFDHIAKTASDNMHRNYKIRLVED